jgi:hypothetical protein
MQDRARQHLMNALTKSRPKEANGMALVGDFRLLQRVAHPYLNNPEILCLTQRKVRSKN